MVDKETKQKLDDIKASETIFMTPETWIDKNGHVFYVDRTPIDFKLIAASCNGSLKGHK